MTGLEYFVLGLECVTLTALCAVFILWVYLTIKDSKQHKVWEYEKSSMLSRTAEMERWCSYEYPIVKEVANYILFHIRSDENYTPTRVEDFREHLIKKYGNKEKCNE